jgi:hypothetical protein
MLPSLDRLGAPRGAEAIPAREGIRDTKHLVAVLDRRNQREGVELKKKRVA